MEAIGGHPFRTKVKRRKAFRDGRVGSQRRSPVPVGVAVVVATGWMASLCFLPWESWRVPPSRLGGMP